MHSWPMDFIQSLNGVPAPILTWQVIKTMYHVCKVAVSIEGLNWGYDTAQRYYLHSNTACAQCPLLHGTLVWDDTKHFLRYICHISCLRCKNMTEETICSKNYSDQRSDSAPPQRQCQRLLPSDNRKSKKWFSPCTAQSHAHPCSWCATSLTHHQCATGQV